VDILPSSDRIDVCVLGLDPFIKKLSDVKLTERGL